MIAARNPCGRPSPSPSDRPLVNLAALSTKRGRIYLIQSGEDGPVKVGWAAHSADERAASLQCGNPCTLYVRFTFRGDRKLEACLHGALRDIRVRGEWFKPATDFLDRLARATHEATRLVWWPAPESDECAHHPVLCEGEVEYTPHNWCPCELPGRGPLAKRALRDCFFTSPFSFLTLLPHPTRACADQGASS